MTKRISVVLGSLLGAVAIHATLVACSAGSTRGGIGGVGGVEGIANAGPDTPAATAATPACTQWEIKTITPTAFGWTDVSYTDPSGKRQSTSMPSVDAMTLEAGWEPIGALYYSPLVRRCVK